MNPTLRRFVAGTQVAGGISGILVFLGIASGGVPSLGHGLVLLLLLALYAFALTAGALLWADRPGGRRLSLLAQALALPRLISPALTVYFAVAVDATLGLEFWWRTADPAFPPGARGGGWWSRWWLGSSAQLSLGGGPPKVAIGVNLVALALLLLLVRAGRPSAPGGAGGTQGEPVTPSA